MNLTRSASVNLSIKNDLVARLRRASIRQVREEVKLPEDQIKTQNALVAEVRAIILAELGYVKGTILLKLDEMHSDVQKIHIRLDAMTRDLKDHMQQLQSASTTTLLQGMLEVATVTSPASFVLLPHRIDAKPSVEQALAGLSLYLDGLDSVMSRAKNSLVPRTFDQHFLYLLDEVTGEPATGPNYPIVVTKASQHLKDLLPLLKLGLRILKIANDVAGLAQCFFPGVVPKLPAETMAKLTGTLCRSPYCGGCFLVQRHWHPKNDTQMD